MEKAVIIVSLIILAGCLGLALVQYSGHRIQQDCDRPGNITIVESPEPC